MRRENRSALWYVLISLSERPLVEEEGEGKGAAGSQTERRNGTKRRDQATVRLSLAFFHSLDTRVKVSEVQKALAREAMAYTVRYGTQCSVLFECLSSPSQNALPCIAGDGASEAPRQQKTRKKRRPQKRRSRR